MLGRPAGDGRTLASWRRREDGPVEAASPPWSVPGASTIAGHVVAAEARRLSRRELVALLGAIGAGGLLAACGVDDGGGDPPEARSEGVRAVPEPTAALIWSGALTLFFAGRLRRPRS